MNRNMGQQFFLQPGGIEQRRYEVLRAVFVNEDTALEVADRFGLSHGTVRNWVSKFGAQLEHGEPPPFSMAVAQTLHDGLTRTNRLLPRTFVSFRWTRDAAGGHDWRGFFCSCRSWLGCGSICLWNRRAIPVQRWCLPPAPC